MSIEDRNGHLHAGDGKYAAKKNGAPGAAATLAAGNDTLDGERYVADMLGDKPWMAIPERDLRLGGFDMNGYAGGQLDGIEIANTSEGLVARGGIPVGGDLYDSAIFEGLGTEPGVFNADQETVDENAVAWLNEHQADIDAVLMEDYGAYLDSSHDTWDSQRIVIERKLASDADLYDALDAVDDGRAQDLADMAGEGRYASVFEEAEKHARDKIMVSAQMGKVLDHLTNTAGNDTAERARYVTMATRWDSSTGESKAVIDFTAFDSQGKQLGVMTVSGFRPERGRIPSAFTVPESDPMEPVLLNRAQNSNSVIDLDKADARSWGRARP